MSRGSTESVLFVPAKEGRGTTCFEFLVPAGMQPLDPGASAPNYLVPRLIRGLPLLLEISLNRVSLFRYSPSSFLWYVSMYVGKRKETLIFHRRRRRRRLEVSPAVTATTSSDAVSHRRVAT